MTARIAAAAGGALLVAAFAAPAAHAAPAFVTPLAPCYVSALTKQGPRTEGFAVKAGGFSVNAKVDLAIDGQPLLDASGVPTSNGLQADPTGLLDLGEQQVPAPFAETGSRDFTVTLTEQGNPANTVAATAKTTALGVTVKPKRAKPSRRIRFAGSGFTAPKAVFAHYVYDGKLRRTVRMARKTGECGSWSARKRQIPVDAPEAGLWTIQFDQRRRYVKPAKLKRGVYVRLGINVRLVPRRD